jgi:peptidoglycan/xylan/chitin deacetylase (PgdA/CDA1 family)
LNLAESRRAVRVVRSLKLEQPIHAVAGSLFGVTTEEPVFHLTFDDGPHADITPRVLDVLDEFGAKATFFVLTERAQQHPDLIHETMRRGHDIALHTRTHPRLTETRFGKLRDEICAARHDLEAVAGIEIEWFRPPYGAQNIRSLSLVKICKMQTVLWSVDSRDWKGLTADNPLERSLKFLVSGGILLLHDVPVGVDEAEDATHGYLPKEELVRLYLLELRERGLEAVSLGELLASGQPLRKAKFG